NWPTTRKGADHRKRWTDPTLQDGPGPCFGQETMSARRRTVARRRLGRGDLERGQSGLQLLGVQAGPGPGPVLRRELKISVPRPVRQDSEDLVQVRERVEV